MAQIEKLVDQLQEYNDAYRSGHPIVDDATYDRLVEQLREIDPQHPFLQHVEPEKLPGRREVRHPDPMLSTEKAYDRSQLERFVQRVLKEAKSIGLEEVIFQVTPKLDGLAGRDDGVILASRGNGMVGYDITSAFDKGVIPVGGRGQGLGEVVVVKSYFDENMATKFEHPRNMVVGIVSSDTLNADAQQALTDGQVRFVPYSQMRAWRGDGTQLLERWDQIFQEVTADVNYPMDGMVVEVCDPTLKARMGATSHHYRWQIAVKTRGETAVTTVTGIQWQVGRTGNITPVLEVEPVPLSGATIRRVTAHHAGMVAKHNIGPGAQIEIIRSGEVIPKLERVLKPVDEVHLPEVCPACGLGLTWKGDFLRCTHMHCPAQTIQRISHWFKTLGTADWFGIKTIEKLVAAGYDSLGKIYAMAESDFVGLGFGPVQSRNLAAALETSKTKPVEDWRFLAALGISDLGTGDSRKLLRYIGLDSLVGVTADRIAQINGFGQITGKAIAQGVDEVRDTLQHLLSLGFNLQRTPLASEESAVKSPISGKKIVFTGKMQFGNREKMEVEAQHLGAQVQTAVNKSTDLLVCGDKVGQTKLDKAIALGVERLSEKDYFRLIGQDVPE